jgi:hypothetical protein
MLVSPVHAKTRMSRARGMRRTGDPGSDYFRRPSAEYFEGNFDDTVDRTSASSGLM